MGEIVRLDTAKDKTHRLAVELFSGFGDGRPAELQCWWLLRLTNRKLWRSHAALATGAQKHQNLVIAAGLADGRKRRHIWWVSRPLQDSVSCRERFQAIKNPAELPTPTGFV